MINRRGFSLIEVLVAVAIMAVLAGAIAPVLINQIEQARNTRIANDLEAIYEAAMGKPQENYFGYVGDVGSLPDSVRHLMDGSGVGSAWSGPYLSLGGNVNATDIYGRKYVIDKNPIRARSFGPDRTDNNGGGDDLVYPENSVGTFKGGLDVQVYINGRIIADATTEQVDATLSYANAGAPSVMNLAFSVADMAFRVDSVHQGIHVLTVNANKATVDPAHTAKQLVKIFSGARTPVQITMQDADYLSRTDTDLNGNGVPDRLEDMDGDGVPDDLDPDIDGDGTPNAIDPDPLNPLVSGGGAGGAPIVSAVSPSFAYQGDSNLLLTIDGAYFQSGATLTFSGTGITVLDVPVIYVGGTQIQVHVNIDAAAAIGLRNVTVTNPNAQAGTGTNLFEVLASGGGGGQPAPSISQAVPNTVNQGASTVAVTINGQNFDSGAIITFSNVGISIVSQQFISSTHMTVTINVSPTAQTGAGTVKVTNPDTKFGTYSFTVQSVHPLITSLNPNNGNSGKQNLWIDIIGANFTQGAAVSITGDPVTIDAVSWVSSSYMKLRVDISYSQYGDDVLIIVINPGGAADSASFHVNGAF